MIEWVFGGGIASFLALFIYGRVAQRLHAQGRFGRPIWMVCAVAGAEAERRGARLLGVRHVARALLSDPDVADELEAKGVRLKPLYDDLEALLDPPGEPRKLRAKDLEASLAEIFRRSRGFFTPARPTRVFEVLLVVADDDLGAVFTRHGVTRKMWSAPRPAPVADGALTFAPEGGPYRRSQDDKKKTHVVFWNDDKTPLVLVLALLRETFGIDEPFASRRMIETDARGSAVIGTYDRDEAERLVRLATEKARAAGFPLKVTTEDASARGVR